MTKIASDSEQFAIVTNIGKTKLNQLAAGQRLVITALALGDGNGTSVIPNADGKSLTHEIGREAITEQSSDYLAAGVFMSSAISAKYQGQWLREVGLIDSEGDLIVWGALASTLVSALSERTIMVHLPLSDVDHITVVVDTAKKFASIDDVSQAISQHAKESNPHEQYVTASECQQQANTSAGEAIAAHNQADNPHEQYATKEALNQHLNSNKSHAAAAISFAVGDTDLPATVQDAITALANREGSVSPGGAQVSWVMEEAQVYNLGTLAPMKLAYWDLPMNDVAIVTVLMRNKDFSAFNEKNLIRVVFFNKDDSYTNPDVQQMLPVFWRTAPIFVPPGAAKIRFFNDGPEEITIGIQHICRLKGASFIGALRDCDEWLLECDNYEQPNQCPYYPTANSDYKCTKEVG